MSIQYHFKSEGIGMSDAASKTPVTTNINIRIDKNIKQEAETLFEKLGMSISGAINIFFRQAIRQQAIPFEIKAATTEMDSSYYRSFDINELHEKESIIVSSEHALKDVVPIKWGDRVLSGQENVLLVADSGTGTPRCKVADIILIDEYYHGGQPLSQHSFVVLSTKGGTIQGLEYSIVCNVLSSFKDEEQKAQKLGYPGNFEISHTDSAVVDGNTKDGYIKAEQIYYFNDYKTAYTVIGKLQPDAYDRLIDYIMKLGIPLEYIIDNLY